MAIRTVRKAIRGVVACAGASGEEERGRLERAGEGCTTGGLGSAVLHAATIGASHKNDRHARWIRGAHYADAGMHRQRHLYLSGPMGAGKSSVGALVAQQLKCPFIDLDREMERTSGQPISGLFASRGEAAFREMEAQLVRMISAGEHSVIALGGGTVERASTRHFLLEHGVVITLRASAEELTRRVTRDGLPARPLLGTTPHAVIEGLLARRQDAYAECDGVVETGARALADIAEEVVNLFAARRDALIVPLGCASYPVILGEGVAARLSRELARLSPPVTQVLVVTDENVAERALRWTQDLSMPVTHVVLEPGESQKTITAVEAIWDAALAARMDRDACVLAIGGGVVGDLAGFAAATLLRGVRLVQMPTTLLAMVDSSTGGKTGFDRAQGKNLIGAFWQPSFVLADSEALSTLPSREVRAGLAEVVKTAWIEGEADVALLERDAHLLVQPFGAHVAHAFTSAIQRSVRTKARIVSEDPHERGARRLLNLGHTFGHALESASKYNLLHGEAVALGLVLAAQCTRALGFIEDASHEARLVALMRALQLPLEAPKLDAEEACSFLRSDKKNAGTALRFVRCEAPGACQVTQVARESLERFLENALHAPASTV